MKAFAHVQTTSRDGVDAVVRSLGALSKGVQVAAVETADYAKRSFEQGTSTAEQLVGARTLDRVFEIQSEYVRASYEGFVAQATKMNEIAAGTAREAFASVQGLAAWSVTTA